VKSTPDAEKLPRAEEFSKALYTFDIGQNDLSVGFRKMSFDQLRAAMPDIVNQLASAVQVSSAAAYATMISVYQHVFSHIFVAFI
jgi:hypothetical protein